MTTIGSRPDDASTFLRPWWFQAQDIVMHWETYGNLSNFLARADDMLVTV